MSKLNKYQSRREFVRKAGKVAISLPLAYLSIKIFFRSEARAMVWQIDPHKCTHCGQCETHCVLTPSAVKCMHAYQMCGYCDLCSGYLRQGVKDLDTGAELQLCPTNAIERHYIEEPYFEYKINEELCTGCAKCALGCTAFGNGSLYMQIKHEICKNCNICSIAVACPSNAISRVPSDQAYMPKAGYKTEE